MNKTTIKLTQFYLAIVGVESVNAGLAAILIHRFLILGSLD